MGVINFLPIQEGTGDPSPENVRPLVAPIVLNIDDAYKFAQKRSGQLNASGAIISESGMIVTEQIPVKAGEVYRYTMTAGTTGARSRRVMCYNVAGTFLSQLNLFNWMNIEQVGTAMVTIPEGAEYVCISQYSGDVEVSFSTAYGTTWPIYGGELDTLKGILSDTHGRFVIDGTNQINTGSNSYNGAKGTDRYANAVGYNNSYSLAQSEWAESLKRANTGIWGRPDEHVWEFAPNGKQIHIVIANEVAGISSDTDTPTRTTLFKEWCTNHPQTFVLQRSNPNSHSLTTSQLHQALDQLKSYMGVLPMTEMTELRRRIVMNEPHIVTPEPAGLVSFDTNMVAPLKDCKVYFGPVWEGTGDPSPDNVRPISGWTGITVGLNSKNFSTAATGTEVVEKWSYGSGNSSKVLTFENMPTNQDFVMSAYFDQAWEVSSNRRVYLNGLRTSSAFFGPAQDAPIRKSVTNKPRENGSISISMNNRGLTYEGIDGPAYAASMQQIQLELGTEPTDYEPYKGQTISFDWTDEAGEVYGGYVDLKTGEVWKTWHMVRVPYTALRGTNFGPNYDGANGTHRYFIISKASPGTANGVPYPISDTLIFGNCSADVDENRFDYNGKNLLHVRLSNNLIGVTSEMTSEERTSAFSSWLEANPVYIVYPLDVPEVVTIEIEKIKTLRGINNIWSNANGNIELSYWKH